MKRGRFHDCGYDEPWRLGQPNAFPDWTCQIDLELPTLVAKLFGQYPRTMPAGPAFLRSQNERPGRSRRGTLCKPWRLNNGNAPFRYFFCWSRPSASVARPIAAEKRQVPLGLHGGQASGGFVVPPRNDVDWILPGCLRLLVTSLSSCGDCQWERQCITLPRAAVWMATTAVRLILGPRFPPARRSLKREMSVACMRVHIVKP